MKDSWYSVRWKVYQNSVGSSSSSISFSAYTYTVTTNKKPSITLRWQGGGVWMLLVKFLVLPDMIELIIIIFFRFFLQNWESLICCQGIAINVSRKSQISMRFGSQKGFLAENRYDVKTQKIENLSQHSLDMPIF